VPAEAAAMLAQYIGEVDREVFVIAMLTVRHRVIGLHTVSVGCLTSSLVHPRLCAPAHNRNYVVAAVMLRDVRKVFGLRTCQSCHAT
jgi:DNA repair protein RadC